MGQVMVQHGSLGCRNGMASGGSREGGQSGERERPSRAGHLRLLVLRMHAMLA